MRDFELHNRTAHEPGKTYTDYTAGGRWAMMSVQDTHLGVRIGRISGDSESSFTIPREVAEFLILDLREALEPTPLPEVPNDTPLGFAFNRSVAEIRGAGEAEAA